MPPPRSPLPGWRKRFARSSPLVLGAALSVLALVQAWHRAGQGNCALLRWEAYFSAFWSGDPIYGVGAEGYPTLPVTILLLAPFRAAGPTWGPLWWALFKIGLAWWIVSSALRLAAGRGEPIPIWGRLLLLFLCFRVLLSDVLHGNINLIVGATVASAAWCWYRRKELGAGFWLGIGAVLKVTPALGVVWLLWRRSGRGLLGLALGLGFGLALPALFVGWERTLELEFGWWDQMVEPYLGSRPLGLLQTEHINQSLLGVLSRHLTDAVAIPAAPPALLEDVRINWLALSPTVFVRVHQAAMVAVVGALLCCLRPRAEAHRGPMVLGEFAMLALAMVFLSERSWKHHWVLLVFPLAFLILHLQLPRTDRRFRVALFGVVASALLHGATGSAFLGHHGSNLAEAYGAFLLGGLVLFVCCGLCLRWCDAVPINGESDAPR